MKKIIKLIFIVSTVAVISCEKDDAPQQQTVMVPGNTTPSTNSTVAAIAQPYLDITVIDIHNHDASGEKYKASFSTWEKYGIDKVVLFGDISEPSAQTTDAIAFTAYQNNQSKIIPFIAGINVFDTACYAYIKQRFAAGVAGIGEVVAASSFSPILAKLPWKGAHPLDGHFDEIYELCAQYNKPILLHIDPPSGMTIDSLKEAARRHPKTKIIFGHANVFNSPANIEDLLKNYNNIYIDFFAGFTAYNQNSQNKLADFVDVIKKYPNRIMMGSDGGFEVGYDKAYTAMYELFNLLPRDVVIRIAGQNYLDLSK